jgi:hypothetical protein
MTNYPLCWISSFDPCTWPARSPDLMLLDYFLWGYWQKPQIREELVQQITDSKNSIRGSY